MRLTGDELDVNAELFCNESADIVDAKPFVQRPWPLKRCQATNVHDEAPDSLLACNNVQINAPGTVTLFQKFWSVALGSHPFFF